MELYLLRRVFSCLPDRSRVNKRFGGYRARPEKSPLLINCHDAKDFLPKVPRGIRGGREGPLILSDSRRHCNAREATSLVRKRRKARAPPSLIFI